jgi:two-component system LytT family response regulator
MMRVIVVDDEQLAIDRAKRVLQKEGISDIDSTTEPLKAIEMISSCKYDIAFLDISMPVMSGLELAQRISDISSDIFIVFATAYEQYALEAYSSGGIGYLVKPIEQSKLHTLIESIKKYTPQKEPIKRLLGKRAENIYLIDIDDIYYIKADLDEVIVKTKEYDAYVKKKISDLDRVLKDKNFYRVHRSYIVNIDKIKSMKSIEQSKLEISFEGIEQKVITSKDGAKEFREYLESKVY